MRRSVILGLLGGFLVVALGGCLGGYTTADSDTGLRDAFNRGLDRQKRDRSFEMRDVLPGDWTGMWFFGGYASSELIEKVVGAPWDGAPDEVAEGALAVVIREPGNQVRGFIWDNPGRRVFIAGCVEDRTGPIAPDERFALLGPIPQERPSANLLVLDTPKSRRLCADPELAPPRKPLGH